MLTLWTLPLALVVLGSSAVLYIHGRLMAKYKPVEAGIRTLEPLLRQRMDLLYELAAALAPAYAPLLALCEAHRDGEWASLCEGHDLAAEAVAALRAQMTASAPSPGRHSPRWDAFMQTDAPFATAAAAYNQAAEAYNTALRPFSVAAKLFLMEPAVILTLF